MIQTISKITINPEQTNQFIKLFHEMVEPTKNEDGYILYELYQDNTESNVFFVLEQWTNQESFDNHLSSAHFLKVIPRMKELMIDETALNITSKII